MLFDKSRNGAEELKEILGFIYASNSFDNLKTDIILAETEIKRLIGAMFVTAEDHYKSDDYLSDETDEDIVKLDRLVRAIQLPVAYHAVYSYAPHGDITHSDKGRGILVTEREKPAFEWMIERDNKALLNKAHKTTDLLLELLETDFAEAWAEAKPESLKGWFIDSVLMFENSFPIGGSRRLFMTIQPFQRKIETGRIQAVLGSVLFEELKAYLNTGEGSDEEKQKWENILAAARPAIALLTMALAVRRLTLEVLPEGIFQNYESDKMTLKAKAIGTPQVRLELSKLLEMEGEREMLNLQNVLQRITAEENSSAWVPVDPTERMTSENKFFRA